MNDFYRQSRLLTFIILSAGFTQPPRVSAFEHPPKSAHELIAERILDDSRPDEDRKKLIEEHPEISSELIETMSKGLDSQPDLKEEYRRIPWIWRVAVAAGKRNDLEETRRILEVSLPDVGAKLRDWQAVVIGGGTINGIGLVGGWPAERIASIVTDHPELQARWDRTQDLAAVMTDDESVAKGTRYDALRILGVGSWDRRGAQIFRYLLKGVDDELQMGAVSALADLRSPGSAQALLSGLSHYSETNRGMALDALLRDDSRMAALLDAVEDRRVAQTTLGQTRIEHLKRAMNPELRRRAETIFGD